MSNGFGGFGSMFGPGIRAEADPGYGPPPGRPFGPGRDGGGILFDELARAHKSLRDFDAAASNPYLQGTIEPTKDLTPAAAKVIVRDIPLVTIQNTWSIEQARAAIFAHMIGIFYTSGMLAESMLGDDRVTACLNAKGTALFGREARFKPANDTPEAKACLKAWQDWWPTLAADSSFRVLDDYATLMGFSHSQILWRDDSKVCDFAPVLRPWFPQFEYYDWDLRRFVAMAVDGNFPIYAGAGKFLEHAPWGSYRGWIRGALRPVCEPWLLRHFGFRDMARFGEVHGNPTRVGYVPMMGDAEMRSQFEQALASLGADNAFMIPRGINQNDQSGYGYELVEATSKSWEVHPAQIDRCDMAIVLAILMQNLTTEVDGGSYGAAKVHQDKEDAGVRFSARAWRNTIYTQVARPFAHLNFGDADLAPWTWWDVTGSDEYEANADQWNKAATGLNQFAQAGMRFDDEEEVRVWISERMGLPDFPKFTMTEPKVAGMTGGESGGASTPKPSGRTK